ncbi:IclR family transcriptional regulator domain-containing protein [Angustibacter sp. McL0619]|uniref:IclR family transcriptional regulator domain-containing protein n=1 Tax=Angustibacter sp. McL0619 TaxID=3415676 RepID=UPI003CEAC805
MDLDVGRGRWAVRRDLAGPVGELFVRTRLTVSAAILTSAGVEFPYRIHGGDELWSFSDVTRRAAVCDTAAGDVLMAWDDKAAAAVLAGLTADERHALIGRLVTVRRNGFAIHASSSPAAVCVAVRLSAGDGEAAALTVRGRRGRVDVPFLVGQLQLVAERFRCTRSSVHRMPDRLSHGR